jgi:hypothetical protein
MLDNYRAVSVRCCEVQHAPRRPTADRIQIISRIIALRVNGMVGLGNGDYARGNGQLGRGIKDELPLQP